MKKIILIVLIYLVIQSVAQVVYANTLWKDISDCMLKYVENHYPNWCVYTFTDWGYHIDKCWLENDYMLNIWKANWCRISTNNLLINFNDTLYCNTALITKKIWEK